MKNLTLFFFMVTSLSYSQDIILQKNGSKISSKILEVTLSDIKYKKFENLDGPVYIISKKSIISITYQNGSIDDFSQLEGQKNDSIAKSNDVANLDMGDGSYMYNKGVTDASINYRGVRCGSGGTLITSLLLSPIAGLIPAIACSSTPPREDNLNFRDFKLKNNPEYYAGYMQKSRKIKNHKIWRNWGIALGLNVVFSVIVISSFQ
jgi:hypothetical protein